MDIIIGLEIEGVTNGCCDVELIRATSVGDVLDHHRACGCSVTLPQFSSVGSVVGLEIESAANSCEICGIIANTSVIDVFDHDRA